MVLYLISWVSISIGIFFVLVGGIGLIRLPDLFSRMHAAGLVDTVGAGFLLVGFLIQSNDWTFYGGGNDIWNTDDQFRFAYQKIAGDFSFSVKVDSLKNTHPYAKAGIMVRKNLNKNYFVLLDV